MEACGGVQRSHVNGLGEFLPLFFVAIFVFSFFLIFMPMEVALRRFFMDPRVSREGLGVTIEGGKMNKTRR